MSSTPYFNQSGSSNTLPPKAAILFSFFHYFLPQNNEVVKDSNEISLYGNLINKISVFYRLRSTQWLRDIKEVKFILILYMRTDFDQFLMYIQDP